MKTLIRKLFKIDQRLKLLTEVYDQPLLPGTGLRMLENEGVEFPLKVEEVKLLDFGCGGGRYTKSFSEALGVDNVFGVDVDDHIRMAKQKGLNCTYLSPSFPILPFSDEAFDIVFSSNVIEHIPHALYLKYLKEIHRVLKPGGFFLVGAPNYPIKRFYDLLTSWRYRHDEKGHQWYYLFDDPTHCNKKSILAVEKDLQKLFCNVYLKPSYILFEDKFDNLKKNQVLRRRLRIFGNKFFGSCRKQNDYEQCADGLEDNNSHFVLNKT